MTNNTLENAGSGGEPQRSRAQFSFFEHFGMAQRNGLSGRTSHGQLESSNEILTKIDNGAPRR